MRAPKISAIVIIRTKSENIAGMKAVRITGAIEIFVMMNHHIEHLARQRRYGSQSVKAELRMLFHYGHLAIVETAGLFENGERNSRLTDVVKHTGERQALPISTGHAYLLTEGHCQSGDKQTMLIGHAVVRPNRIDPRRKALRLDMADYCVARGFDRWRIEWLAEACRREDVLQGIDCRGNRRRFANCRIVGIGGQRCDVAPQYRKQLATVNRKMQNVRGSERVGPGTLQKRSLVDQKYCLCIRRFAPEAIP